MTEPVAPYNGPVMWADGSNLILSISAPEGLLYQQTIPMAVFSARIAGDGEIIRFTYDWTDPEDGTVTRGAGRLVLQDLPDPRAEEQPAAPADATAPSGFGMPDSFLEGFRRIANATAAGNPADDPITPEERAEGARWIERPSGPPVRVDGPGCTPATVSVPCLGEGCTGCSDPQCPTALADGGDV